MFVCILWCVVIMILDYYELTILLTEGVYSEDLDANHMDLTARKKRTLLKKLGELQEFMRDNKLVRKNKNQKYPCHYQAKHVIEDKNIYLLDDIVWTGQLAHYIEHHNYVPSPIFEKMLNTIRYKDSGVLEFDVSMDEVMLLYKKSNLHLDTVVIKQGAKENILITHDQLRMLDSLFVHSSEKMMNGEDYAEAMAYLDFQQNSLEHIKIKLNPKYMFKSAEDILYFHFINEKDAIDYEFLVHTHPLTPDLATRIEVDNIIFDFPSATDILTYIELSAKKQTQGSIVIAVEGIYLIRNLTPKSVVVIDKEEFQYEYNTMVYDLNEKAIEKHYTDTFTMDVFMKKTIRDRHYINALNKFIRPFNVTIDYHPRTHRNGRFVLTPFTVEVIPIEIEIFHH